MHSIIIPRITKSEIIWESQLKITRKSIKHAKNNIYRLHRIEEFSHLLILSGGRDYKFVLSKDVPWTRGLLVTYLQRWDGLRINYRVIMSCICLQNYYGED